MEKANVPLSPAVKANGFVFCSGMPPMNPETGEIVRGYTVLRAGDNVVVFARPGSLMQARKAFEA